MKLQNGYFLILLSFLSFDKSLQFNPEKNYIWKDKANFLKKLNRLDEALEWFYLNNYNILSFNKALQLNP